MDVHKDTIAVAVGYPGRSKPKSVGIIANTKKSVLRLMHKLSPDGEVLGFCYEAGPCKYEVYRWIKEAGHDCDVVAPSKIEAGPSTWKVKTGAKNIAGVNVPLFESATFPQATYSLFGTPPSSGL